MQLLLQAPGHGLTCLNFEESIVSIHSIQYVVENLFGIPQDQQRLVCSSKELQPSQHISLKESLQIGPIQLKLRLLGGKGGFGSLLRGQQTKVGQKKMVNMDACRDLNGRRLRHTHNQRRLAQWYAQEKERELENKALDHIKKMNKKQYSFDETAYKEEINTIEENVVASVEAAFKESKIITLDLETKKPDTSNSASLLWYYSDESSEEEEEEEEEEEKEEEEDEKKEKEKKKSEKKKEKKSKETKEENSTTGKEENESNITENEFSHFTRENLEDQPLQKLKGICGQYQILITGHKGRKNTYVNCILDFVKEKEQESPKKRKESSKKRKVKNDDEDMPDVRKVKQQKKHKISTNEKITITPSSVSNSLPPLPDFIVNAQKGITL